MVNKGWKVEVRDNSLFPTKRSCETVVIWSPCDISKLTKNNNKNIIINKTRIVFCFGHIIISAQNHSIFNIGYHGTQQLRDISGFENMKCLCSQKTTISTLEEHGISQPNGRNLRTTPSITTHSFRTLRLKDSRSEFRFKQAARYQSK